LKILTFSAYYPPYAYGGYENRVRDVMDGLAARGHQVNVMTTKPDKTMQVESILFDYPVVRTLYGTRRAQGLAERLTTKKSTNRLGVAIIFLRQIWRDIHDLRIIDQTIKKYQPDLVYLGNVTFLTRSLFPFLASLTISLMLDDGGKTTEIVYADHGLWYRFLEGYQPKSGPLVFIYHFFILLVSTLSGGRLKRKWSWPDRIDAFFNSQNGQESYQAKVIPNNSTKVIQSGLDLEKFAFRPISHPNRSINILVPGRIEPIKGQMDAVRLSSLLSKAGVKHSLTIVGDHWNLEYVSSLEREVVELGLVEQIKILPYQKIDAMIDLYQHFDICYFPSYQKLGFSRVPIEAMACGCVLISYGGECSTEIIQNDQNGFLVPPGDIDAVSDIVCSLANYPKRLEQISVSARNFVERNHSMTGYLNQIEAFLYEVIDQKAEK